MARAVTRSIPFDEFLCINGMYDRHLKTLTDLSKILLEELTVDRERVHPDYIIVLEVVLCNFFISKKHNVYQSIPLMSSYWSKNSRPKQNNTITYRILKHIIDGLLESKFIRMVKNYSSGVASIGKTGRTRIYETTPKLKKLFDQYQLNETAIIQQIGHPQYPFVQLKDFRSAKIKRQKFRPRAKQLRLEKYRNSYVDVMEQELRSYNQFLSQVHLDLYVTDKEEVTIRREMAQKINDDDELVLRELQLHKKFIYRVFNNRSWESGGRFYGGWWLSIKSKWRHRITINNNVTTEIDYSSMHFTMLYQDCKSEIAEELTAGNKFDSSGLFDPYDLQNFNPKWQGVEIPDNRNMVKDAMNIMLNSSDEKEALAVIRNDKDKFPKIPTGFRTWKSFTDHILDCHKGIADKFYTGAGLHYQFKDSQIASRVMSNMANKHNACVLPVHDSFIIEASKSESLIREMREVANEMGYKIPLTVSSTPKKNETTSYKNVMTINKDDCSNYFKRLQNHYDTLPVIYQDDVLIPPSFNPEKFRKLTWREEYQD